MSLFYLLSSFLVANLFAESSNSTEYRVASVTHKVRAHASLDAPQIGIIYSGDVFEVGPIVGYTDCAAGWAKVSGGVVCLVKTTVVADEPIDLPAFLDVLPPLEADATTLPPVTAQEPAFMPVLFGRRDATHEGRLWPSVESYEQGEEHKWRLKEGKDYRFVDVHETSKGWVLERPNGSVSPISDIYVYPVSRFQGRDIEQFPLMEGNLIAWVNNPHGTAVYWDNGNQDSGLRLERRRILEWIPSEDATEYVKIPMGDVDGYVLKDDLTLWNSMEAPSSVESDDVWIDADIETQMLAVMQGDDMLYVTLMSTAKKGHSTPLGTYQIYDKSVGWDLGSREGSDDPYYMERVPFVMHYYPRYAIHSAFWHDNFGEPASHGCINLAPKDALAVYQRVSPTMPRGWQFVKQHEEDPGTVVRIRNGDTTGKSKRIRP